MLFIYIRKPQGDWSWKSTVGVGLLLTCLALIHEILMLSISKDNALAQRSHPQALIPYLAHNTALFCLGTSRHQSFLCFLLHCSTKLLGGYLQAGLFVAIFSLLSCRSTKKEIPPVVTQDVHFYFGSST